jgi:hypothetical protein
MRILPVGALCAAAVCLSGCGGGLDDNQMLASFREHQVQSCIAGVQASPQAANLGLDGPRLCGCAIDRYMAGKSAADLRNADPHDPALRDATHQCQIEQMRETLEGIANGPTENSTAAGH